ncbi:MAG: UDP-glucose--hexose-1-phosphate uridylyltransferase [Anaerolineales bacterium]|nr:UDP-glucose--hexose-1-phosphate uridylyltransferase [Chloroflexota bacterium]MBL6983685.1 UDP-glucose--hexose-1-phosphate uridylyltransferase [Anaerolineales bacterium]
MKFDSTEHPHRRYNLLTGEYIFVSPHRTKRPWQGQVETTIPDQRPAHDPKCYLCPGNERAGGGNNPQYEHTLVFTNDFAALLPDVSFEHQSDQQLFQEQPVRGTCRVICFSPRHDLTLPEMAIEDIRKVIDVWAEQTTELGQQYQWVQVFENKGSMMGCSNPHPHGQIWSLDALPNEPAKEELHQDDYFSKYQRPLLLDYVDAELGKETRVIEQNDHWVFAVPYWAVWPFETLLLPREHVLRLPDLNTNQRDALADILKRLLTRYDNLFETSFPYSMGWHGAPFNDENNQHWQLHAHFYPPLLRSATVKKFMVGYEMLAEAQRDITAEQAADRLRAVSDVHFKLDPLS